MLMQKNRKIVITISRLALAALLCIGALSSYAAEDKLLVGSVVDSAEQMAAYQQQIEDLEFDFGPYHSSLIEPLESMIELLNETEDYEQVAQLQNRQLQVMRTELGFEHPDLIPLLQSIMATQLALGNWEEISDQLEHIRHLRTSIDAENTELLLSAIQDQIDWLFSRITIEDRKEQVLNFFKARDLYEEIEDIVEDSYGEDSLEAAPWLYKVAYNEYHLVSFLNASKGVGSESVDRLVRREGTFGLESQNRYGLSSRSFFGNSSVTPVIERGRPIGDGYLRDAYSMVNKIQDVVEETSDIEAQAMMKIYRSDFQLLSDRGSAIRGYREARDMLLEAGIAEEDVLWFFERPMVIPMEALHLNFADALAELRGRIESFASVKEQEMHLGMFTSWTEALDSTPMPQSKNPFWQLDYPFKYADVSFSVNSRGKASSVDVLATGPEDLDSKRSIWRSVRDIHFRPAIIDNKARRVKDVRMRYQFIDD
ncbi:MAG: hypothetical protein COB20_04030 [SAR86 cluster bacterium]|uniref:TonB C-terminal domain-containing protein n=1 Tax=SAR86 cluster bacterium TaxID=2030880 RepID=A0A2A4XBS6_9GAMM|nr:MAG: hypothetical protein COB20_04030 [SAR86 cluster bacterium]